MKKRVVALLTALCVLLCCGASAETVKHERVFAVVDSQGNVSTLLDNVRLENGDKLDNVTDRTMLTGVENVSGHETFTQDGEVLTWQLNGESVIYQGTSDKTMDVVPVVRMTVDGKEVTAEELKGLTGEVTIEVTYTTEKPYLALTVLPLDENQKLLICFGSGADMQIVAGYADDIVKDGIRRCWKIRRVSEQRQFFRRVDERLRATIPIKFTQPTWKPNADGIIVPEDGMTLDISAGGLACYLNRGMNVGEVCEMTLPTIGAAREGHEIAGAVAVICWTREAPKGSPFRRVAGFQFRFADSVERQQMQDYVENIKKRYKL